MVSCTLKKGRGALKTALFVSVLLIGFSGEASADLNESLNAIKAGEYSRAFDSLMKPIRATVNDGTRLLEEGTCTVIVATMPPVERGLAVVEALVGDIYYMGHGVPKDYVKAVKWYKRAADKGNALSQSTLGDVYYYGYGVPQNYVEAAKWWQRAADQGVHVAQLNLSVMFANGDGVAKNLVKSHMYANLAASGLPPGKDRDTAASNRDYVTSLMTPKQIFEAQRLAKEWRPKSSMSASGADSGQAPAKVSVEQNGGLIKPQKSGGLAPSAAKREKVVCRW